MEAREIFGSARAQTPRHRLVFVLPLRTNAPSDLTNTMTSCHNLTAGVDTHIAVPIPPTPQSCCVGSSSIETKGLNHHPHVAHNST